MASPSLCSNNNSTNNPFQSHGSSQLGEPPPDEVLLDAIEPIDDSFAEKPHSLQFLEPDEDLPKEETLIMPAGEVRGDDGGKVTPEDPPDQPNIPTPPEDVDVVAEEKQPEAIISHPLQRNENGPTEPSATSVVESDVASDASSSKSDIKKHKRVSFRGDSDEDVVTGYFDALDPFRYAYESSVQNVMEAYAHLCLQHKVQPLPKVLESIKRNPGSRQRAGSFDLSGESIDLAAVDTFEAVFMRMCFEELNLDRCLTDDELAVSLMDMLEYYQMADKLVVSNNKKLQFRGWLAIAKILKQCCIYYLDVRGCVLHDQYASLLTRALRCGSNIVTLHMENCNLSGRPTFLLISALQFSETVQELFLADNRLTPTDMIHFASALKHGWRIRLLDLRNNAITDSGASHLFDMIEGDVTGNGGLRALVLWNNGLTSHMAKTLARALARTKTLETLNLGMNDLTDETIYAIKEALMKNRSLRRLGLQSTKISDEGCIALAEFLADHPRFLRLDIRNNEIRCAGWLSLSHAAKLSPALIRMDMSFDLRDMKHTDTVRESFHIIQTACVNNLERFEKDTSPQPLEDVAEVAEQDEPKDVLASPTGTEPEKNTSQTDDDLEGPRCDFPEFMGSFGKDPEPSLDIDIPHKKGRPSALRRCSITSVSATGPLSVCDRLHEELFPVRPPFASTSSSHMVKGRFQISLVKATEKIYQSVQSVLSPTNGSNNPSIGSSTEHREPTTQPDGGKPGLFSWRATFRRGSKDSQPVEFIATAVATGGGDRTSAEAGDSRKGASDLPSSKSVDQRNSNPGVFDNIITSSAALRI